MKPKPICRGWLIWLQEAKISSSPGETLPFTAEHAAGVGSLAPLHRDPFDRVMVAKAAREPLIFLIHGRQVAEYGAMVRLV